MAVAENDKSGIVSRSQQSGTAQVFRHLFPATRNYPVYLSVSTTKRFQFCTTYMPNLDASKS